MTNNSNSRQADSCNLVLSIWEDLERHEYESRSEAGYLSLENVNPYDGDFGAWANIPLLKKLEIRGGQPDHIELAGFVQRHAKTLRSISLTGVPFICHTEWQDFAGLTKGVQLTEVVIDMPLANCLEIFVSVMISEGNAAVQEAVMEGDVNAALTKFQRAVQAVDAEDAFLRLCQFRGTDMSKYCSTKSE